jgi:hypothetical protein
VTSLDFVVAALSVLFFFPSSAPLLAAAPLGGSALGSGSVSAVALISGRGQEKSSARRAVQQRLRRD